LKEAKAEHLLKTNCFLTAMATYRLPDHENSADTRKKTVKFTLIHKCKIVKRLDNDLQGMENFFIGKTKHKKKLQEREICDVTYM
jgi:hypothetical protein